MAQEIERKFLVRNDSFKKLAYNYSRIAQGYICSGRGRTVRVRIRDEKGFLTIKGPAGENAFQSSKHSACALKKSGTWTGGKSHSDLTEQVFMVKQNYF